MVQGSEHARLRSTHLYAEALGEYLAVAEGLIDANGRCFDDVASTQPVHFVEYRQAWVEAMALGTLAQGPSATLVGEIGCDVVETNAAGAYSPDEDFLERRSSRELLAAEGDAISITELRQKFSGVAPLNPTGTCP
jgi:hypothetical protein